MGMRDLLHRFRRITAGLIGVGAFVVLGASTSVRAAEIDPVVRGCSLGMDVLSAVVPIAEMQASLEGLQGRRVGSSLEECASLGRALSIALRPDVAGAKGPSLRGLIDIMGPSKSRPEQFNVPVNQCVVEGKVSPDNCNAGCLYHYLSGPNAGVFVGFASSWQMFFAPMAKAANIDVGRDFAAKCTNASAPGGVAECTLRMCAPIHEAFVKATLGN